MPNHFFQQLPTFAGTRQIIGQSQDPLHPLLVGVTSTTAFAQPACSQTQPPTLNATAKYNDAARLAGGDMAVEMFGHGAVLLNFGGTDAENEVFEVEVWRVRMKRTGAIGGDDTDTFLYEIAAELTVTLGTETYADAGLGATTALWADTITESTVHSGVSILPVQANHRAGVVINAMGASLIYVVCRRADASGTATCDVWAQLVDASTTMSTTVENMEVSLDTLDNLVHTEDAAHTSGDSGMMPLAVRTDTRAALAGTTGDYAPQQLTANGDLRVRDDDANTDLAAIEVLNTAIKAAAVLSPTAASGQLMTLKATDDASADLTLVDGAKYRVTAVNGILYLGIADTDTDANVLWTVPAGASVVITMSGTTLKGRSDSASVYARVARIA